MTKEELKKRIEEETELVPHQWNWGVTYQTKKGANVICVSNDHSDTDFICDESKRPNDVVFESRDLNELYNKLREIHPQLFTKQKKIYPKSFKQEDVEKWIRENRPDIKSKTGRGYVIYRLIFNNVTIFDCYKDGENPEFYKDDDDNTYSYSPEDPKDFVNYLNLTYPSQEKEMTYEDLIEWLKNNTNFYLRREGNDLYYGFEDIMKIDWSLWTFSFKNNEKVITHKLYDLKTGRTTISGFEKMEHRKNYKLIKEKIIELYPSMILNEKSQEAEETVLEVTIDDKEYVLKELYEAKIKELEKDNKILKERIEASQKALKGDWYGNV